MNTAAIYARVSLDQQKQEKTIASQTAALVEFARSEGYSVPPEWILQDEGYIVRTELVRLIDGPTPIQAELNRRLEGARNASPAKRRQETIIRGLFLRAHHDGA